MVTDSLPESRLRELSELGNKRPTEAFAALANETRLAILLVLWDATEPDRPGPKTSPMDEAAVSFSDLYDRVEYSSSANFQYHLQQLTGHFVRKTDSGYTLTTSAERILSVVLSGSMTGSPSFEDEPLDAACMRCGGPTLADYHDGVLVQRCADCEGVVRGFEEPKGVIAKEYRPPVGMQNRTPREFVQEGKTWDRLRRHALIEGTCPDCSGTVTATLHVCEHHERPHDDICDHCRRVHSVQAVFVCDVCKCSLKTGVWSAILIDVAVIAFFHEHGLDTMALEDNLEYGVLFDAIETVTAHSEDPLEVVVTVELDGDSLLVTLDDDASVTDVTEQSRHPL